MDDISTLPAGRQRLLFNGVYDGFDLCVVENQAAGLVADVRGVPDWKFEDNFVRSSIQHEAYSLVDASIISIGSHPDYRPTDPDFWERVIDGVRKALAGPAAKLQESFAPAPLATPQELTELRLKLHGMGYHPVPIIGAHIDDKAAGKRPTMTAWQTKCLTADPHEIASWSGSQRNNTNTGILCGEVVGIDIDVLDVTLSANLVARAQELFGETPLRRIGRAPKILLLYRVETPHNKLATADLLFDDGSKAKVEILAEGQQFVAFGTHPDTRAPYHWPEKSPLDIAASDVPVVSLKTLEQFVAEAEEVLSAAGGRTAGQIKGKTKVTSDKRAQNNREKQGKIAGAFRDGEKQSYEKIADALDHIPNDLSYDDWIRIGYSLYEGTNGGAGSISGRDFPLNTQTTIRKLQERSGQPSPTVGPSRLPRCFITQANMAGGMGALPPAHRSIGPPSEFPAANFPASSPPPNRR